MTLNEITHLSLRPASVKNRQIMMDRQRKLTAETFLFIVLTSVALVGCARTQIIESPRTAYVPESAEIKEPAIVWTSRAFGQDYDYLGQIRVRSWTYDGAVERMIGAAKQLRADAVIDVHYDEIGFFTTLDAFAIKYK